MDAKTTINIEDIEGGGVTSAQGFKAAGVHAGFRANKQRLDFALVVADEPCSCAATFTQNEFCAAPVRVARAQLADGGATADSGPAFGCTRAIMVNSGNANAATGEMGMSIARESLSLAASELGCPESEVLIASTGVIGKQLSLESFRVGLPLAHAALSRDGGLNAANAIMTTDTKVKQAACTCIIEPDQANGLTEAFSFTIGGMAKGSGMIMPNMATMIAIITTDIAIAPPYLHEALTMVVGQTFNKVTVDSDTSTNDSCFLLASGVNSTTTPTVPSTTLPTTPSATPSTIKPNTPIFNAFVQALLHVCTQLARAMATDGEGATRLLTIHVRGAANEKDADLAARTVANSPLVKTAVFGHDANWGRIAAALGRSGAHFSQENVDIRIMDMLVCEGGLAVSFDEDEALRRFEAPEIILDINLGAGLAETTIWTCDFSYDYVRINGEYRT